MRRCTSSGPWALVPAALLIVGCGGGGGETCETGDYPPAPQGATATLHVAAGCPEDGADGSAARPYPRIGDALARAPSGAAVLIAAGDYPERVKITQPVSLVGSGDPTRPEAAAAVLVPGSSPGTNCDGTATSIPLVVCGTQGVTLSGLRVRGAATAGIKVSASSATLEGTTIEDTAEEGGIFGHGLVVSDASSIILQRSAITGSARFGVLVSNAGAIILQNTIRGNAGGGVRLERSAQNIEISGNLIEGNTQFGLGVFSSKAIILQNIIQNTVLDADKVGDGVVASRLRDPSGMGDVGPSDVEMSDNDILGNDRVGVLLGSGARGIILQNNDVGQNGARAPFGAGVWLQGGAGTRLVGNRLSGNRFTGIGATGAGTRGIILQNNEISGTTLGSTFTGATDLEIGDGIGLFAGAAANIEANRVIGNGRFGLILDSAEGVLTTITGNTFEDNNQFGIILQGQAVEPPIDANSFRNNRAGDVRQGIAGGTFGVRTEELLTQ